MAKTVADLLVERLIGWGVKTIFGFPGDGINGFFEALRTHEKEIRFIQVRHEEAAAFAACGHAKYTGQIGVCCATSGPGGVHLLNGLYDAKCDGVPVLAITGHTFSDMIGTHFQQDVDLTKLFMDVAVYNERLMGPTHVDNCIDEAIRTALGRRGVAHVCIPKDIQEWTATEKGRTAMNVKGHSGGYANSPLLPDPSVIRQAADLINSGSKVALLAGRGCLGASSQLLQLAEKAAAPIVKALLGKAVVPDDHPYTTGGLGLLGTAPSQEAMKGCDTLVIVGSSFPCDEFLPKPGQAKCVQINIDPARIGLRYPVDVGLMGDCGRVLDALLPMIERKKDRSYLEKAQKSMKEWNDLLQKRATVMEKPLKPQVVAAAVNKYLADDAVIACDCGTVTTWGARYVKMRERMQFSASGLLATMGNGMPYALAAALAYPGRQVVALCGDGGFTMMMGEMATMVKYNLPVKVVIFKNNTLGQIKWEQMVMEGNPEFGVDLQPIDFAAYARACGAAGFAVDDPKNVDGALREAFAHPGPALVEATIDAHEPPLPGHATMSQMWHFAKSLIRGEKYAPEIIKTVLADTIRQVV